MSRQARTSRREFLARSAIALAGAALAAPLARAARLSPPNPVARKIPIGLQLYAVRGSFTKDVPGTLEGIAKIGYRAVEFWGYRGTEKVFGKYSARELRALLDANHLTACGMHMAPEALEGERFARTVENNRALGNRNLIVAAAPARMRSKESIATFARFLTGAAKRAAGEKMRVGYHAHGFDFKRIDGRFAWDHLFSRLGEEVIMQMDVGNCLGGGGDPIAMLEKYPGRTATIHIKEHEEKTFASAFYKKVFELCDAKARTEWLIVEMGGPGGNGLDIPRDALRKLRAAGR